MCNIVTNHIFQNIGCPKFFSGISAFYTAVPIHFGIVDIIVAFIFIQGDPTLRFKDL